MRIPFDRREFLATSAMSLACSPCSPRPISRRNRRCRVGQIGVGHAHASELAVYRDSTDYEVLESSSRTRSFASGLDRSRLFVTFPG